MADARIRQAVKLVDPTTDANEAAVDASGNLQVILASNTGVDVGDVDVASTPADAIDAAAHGASQVGFRAMGSDGTNDQQLAVDAAGQLQVDVLTGGGGPEDTDDDVVAGGQSAVLTIGFNYGWDGTQWERLTTDASGSLDVNVTLPLPTGGNNIGDVDVVGGTLASDAPLTTNPVTMGGRASTATPTPVSADGDVVDLWLSREGAAQVDVLSGGGGPEDSDDDIVAGGQTAVLGIAMNYGYDGTQWERITTDAAGSMDVNVTLPLPGGTNNIGDVDVLTLPYSDGFGAASGEPAEAAFIAGTDGTDTYGVLVDTAGRLQVDVITGGGSDSPTGPTMDADIVSAVAPGGTGFLDSAEITEAEKVWQITVAATVPFKVRFGMQENTVRNPKTGWMFGLAGTTVAWSPGHRDFLVHVGTSGGTDTIYGEVFNMDNNETADIHGTFEYST